MIIPTLEVGGMERIITILANSLVNKDLDITMLLMFKHEIFYPLDPKIKIVQPSKKKLSNFSYAFFLFPFLRKQIKKAKADAVLSFGERYNSWVLFASLGLNIPVFVSDRGSPHKPLSKLNIWLSKVLYKRAGGIISQTSQAAELMSQRLKGKYSNIRVIPNPLRHITYDGQEKKNQIIALGRLVREKRYDRLMYIMSRLKNQTWKLVIVGEGPFRGYIENLIDQYKLNDRVVLLGRKTNVDKYLAESKIFVMTSDSEGFPNALCEGMAHGLACISIDCVAGPSDIIDNGNNGILIKDEDLEGFAQELDDLICDENKRNSLGKEAEKIRDRLDGNRIFAEYFDFIYS